MTQITKPMLAGKCESMGALTYPVLATPKLDGIRCLVVGGKALSRKFLPIPNDYIRQTIEMTLNSMQLDGEIIIKGRDFNQLSGDVRRKDGRPTNFTYAVFDYVQDGLRKEYKDRMKDLACLLLPPFCKRIVPVTINGELDLLQYETDQLALGYEGVMVRSPSGPYKCGRSTANEGYLLKIKRFEDSEAKIIGYECEYENQNVAGQDAFGRTKRSSNAENLVGKDRLGKIDVTDLKTGVGFSIGTGFDAATRVSLWAKRDELIGKVVKYKHQPSGADERPRFPVFLGFRDSWDM